MAAKKPGNLKLFDKDQGTEINEGDQFPQGLIQIQVQGTNGNPQTNTRVTVLHFTTINGVAVRKRIPVVNLQDGAQFTADAPHAPGNAGAHSYRVIAWDAGLVPKSANDIATKKITIQVT